MNNNRPGNRRALLESTLVLISLLCVLCGNLSAQRFKKVHPGVEHARVDHKIGSDPVKINLLRLDLAKVRLDVHHAFDKAIGLEKPSSIAMRHGAVAAINAGFFRLDRSEFAGDAAGLLQIDGKLLSESSNDRIAIAITNSAYRTFVSFDHYRAHAVVGFSIDSSFAFDGINRERKPHEIILFTPEFASTTKTNSDGTEIVLSKCVDENHSSKCESASVLERQGGATIPEKGFVISIGKDALTKSNGITAVARQVGLHAISPFNTFRIVFHVAATKGGDPFSSVTEDITNGVPLLIKKGKVDITWKEEKASKSFVEMRHPRTAVAKLKNGKFLMITVDGRQPGVSVGMTLQELADYLLSIGARDAINLDGGGSTTMFLDGKVTSTPSDKEGERKVGDAILVTLRKNARMSRR